MKYIDIHCHINLDEFDIDRNEAIQRARERGVGMIVVGVDRKSSEMAIKLAEENSDIWAVIGMHPADSSGEVFDESVYRKMAQHPRVVAIGEVGLDYNHDRYESRKAQQEIFEKMIALANEVKKPLMLHIRSGIDKEKNAYQDVLPILKRHAKVHGDVHFFAGTSEEAKQFIELGFRLSFTGVITFTHDYDEVIKNTPLNMIMSETDAPFVSPIPYRGQRNEPSYVVEVVEAIAKIKGEPIEKVREHLIDNACKLFSISNL
jgi:TatD DNase family protein